MDAYDAIILTIAAHEGQISGRTTFQKLIYFATLKVPECKIPYTHHYYGPFSKNVARSLEDLTAFDYLREQITSSQIYESYVYDLTPEGAKLVDSLKQEKQDEYKAIKDIVDTCDKFCGLKASILSYAAKAYYILTHSEKHQREGITSGNVKELGTSFGWQISKDDAETGFELLAKLNLVKPA